MENHIYDGCKYHMLLGSPMGCAALQLGQSHTSSQNRRTQYYDTTNTIKILFA